jgi:hypothetical protein
VAPRGSTQKSSTVLPAIDSGLPPGARSGARSGRGGKGGGGASATGGAPSAWLGAVGADGGGAGRSIGKCRIARTPPSRRSAAASDAAAKAPRLGATDQG